MPISLTSVHDNQTLADGILDLQRAGLPVVTTIHHPITRDLRVALSAEPVGWRRLLADAGILFCQCRPESRRNCTIL